MSSDFEGQDLFRASSGAPIYWGGCTSTQSHFGRGLLGCSLSGGCSWQYPANLTASGCAPVAVFNGPNVTVGPRPLRKIPVVPHPKISLHWGVSFLFVQYRCTTNSTSRELLSDIDMRCSDQTCTFTGPSRCLVSGLVTADRSASGT
jgi:hypothetical protein